MAIEIVMIFVISIVFFILLNCKAWNALSKLFHERDWSWKVIMIILVLFPLLTGLLTHDVSTWKELFIAHVIWYLIPVVILWLTTKISRERLDEESEQVQIKRHWLQATLISIGIVLLGIGFDNRYTKIFFEGIGEAYSFNSLLVSAIMFLFMFKFSSVLFKDCPWKIDKQVVKISLIGVAVLFIIAVPIGLSTRFLAINPQWNLLLVSPLILFGIYMTIALDEELFMRAYFLNAWDTLVAREKWERWGTLLITSLIFGISHWNNTSPEMMPWYILLATIAGIIYGIAWWKGRMHAAMLTHALVDWIWLLFFKAT